MEPNEQFEALTDESKPWHRQSRVRDGKTVHESAKAHRAFREFAEMGDDRSVLAVGRKLAKSKTLMQRWAKTWAWAERARAFDAMVHDVELAAGIKARAKMVARQSQVAVLAQNVATLALQTLMGELQLDKDGNVKEGRRRLTPNEIARLLDTGAKIERICRGEPEEDQVASISVSIRERDRPRYADYADDQKKAKQEFDA